MEPSSLRIYRTKKWPKNGLKARKLWHPKVGGLVFMESSRLTDHNLFWIPSNIYMLPLELQDDL